MKLYGWWNASLLLPISVLTFQVANQIQRDTIPDLVAKGAVSSVATAPSGPAPTVADLLRSVDVVVTGTIGDGRSYLSDDQRDIYTDYPLAKSSLIFESHLLATKLPGALPTIVVTQLGGTVLVGGTTFTQKQSALPPLRPGTQGLFLLQRVADKYCVAGRIYGAFSIDGGVLRPLVAVQDFAPDYRGLPVARAVQSITAALSTRK